MDLKIQSRNLELNEAVREHITKKVDRLSRHLPGITSAVVELARGSSRDQTGKVVAQVTLDIDGSVLRGEERGANAMAAVDSAIDVMDRRVERYKGKVYRSMQPKKSGRGDSIRIADAPPPTTEEEDQVVFEDGSVVKVKRFPIKPMAVDEAAFQMELLGHSFFLFVNGDTEQHNVIYRRNDGDYGLIEPEPL